MSMHGFLYVQVLVKKTHRRPRETGRLAHEAPRSLECFLLLALLQGLSWLLEYMSPLNLSELNPKLRSSADRRCGL